MAKGNTNIRQQRIAKNTIRQNSDPSFSIGDMLDGLSYHQVIRVCHGVICAWDGEEYAVDELPKNLKNVAVKMQIVLDRTRINLLMDYIERKSKEKTKDVQRKKIPLLKELTNTL